MYTIGELSKAVNLSVDAIRYYDEIGLVKPHHIDPVTRYRYYSADQINRIIEIMEWKQYGFSLDAIRELLQCHDPKRLLGIFEIKLQERVTERIQVERTIQLLNERILRLKEGPMNKRTVLIVDDSPFIRQFVEELLEKHGFKVMGASADGEQGMEMYREHKPDVVLLDIGLPGIDGVEVLGRIKALDSSARVVMCSARGNASNVLQCLKEGAADFVVKPFLPDALLDAVNGSLKREAARVQPDTLSLLQKQELPRDIILSQFMIRELVDLSQKPCILAGWEMNELLERMTSLTAEAAG
jgi:DNA-binding NarL/FixJ family response regulator